MTDTTEVIEQAGVRNEKVVGKSKRNQERRLEAQPGEALVVEKRVVTAASPSPESAGSPYTAGKKAAPRKNGSKKTTSPAPQAASSNAEPAQASTLPSSAASAVAKAPASAQPAPVEPALAAEPFLAAPPRVEAQPAPETKPETTVVVDYEALDVSAEAVSRRAEVPEQAPRAEAARDALFAAVAEAARESDVPLPHLELPRGQIFSEESLAALERETRGVGGLLRGAEAVLVAAIFVVLALIVYLVLQDKTPAAVSVAPVSEVASVPSDAAPSEAVSSDVGQSAAVQEAAKAVDSSAEKKAAPVALAAKVSMPAAAPALPAGAATTADLAALRAALAKTGAKNAGNEVVLNSIAAASKTYEVDPFFVAALVMAESSLNPNVRSKDGKIGLLQILPETAARIRKLRGDTASGSLFNPEYNLDLGVWYLNSLRQRYNGDLMRAALAFSAGTDVADAVVAGTLKTPPQFERYQRNIQRWYDAWTAPAKPISEPAAAKTAKNRKPAAAPARAQSVAPVVVAPVVVAPAAVAPSAAVAPAKTELRYTRAWEKFVMGFAGLNVEPAEREHVIALVKEKSAALGLDAALVASVIMAESSFDPKVISAEGKRGLLQLEPQWAKTLAQLLGKEWKGADALLDAEYNLDLGLAYLQHLAMLFEGNIEKAILTHNLNQMLIAKILGGKEQFPSLGMRYIQNVNLRCRSWGCRRSPGYALTARLTRQRQHVAY